MSEPRRLRWILLGVFIVLFAVASVRLGFWQLSRLEQRRAENAIVASRLARAPIDLTTLIAELELASELGDTTPLATGEDFEFTKLTAHGTFSIEGAVRVRLQVHAGIAGSHSVYVLNLGDGAGVLVNVGWIGADDARNVLPSTFPLESDVVGVVRATQLRPAIGPVEPDGPLENVARIDIERIQDQVAVDLLPIWIQMTQPLTEQGLPIPVELPRLEEGSHLSYAIQWFSFALIAVAVYAAMVRTELVRRRRAAAAAAQGSPGPVPPTPESD